MQKTTYTKTINAPVEKVWHTMLDKPTYNMWARVFDPSSSYEGEWSTGSKMLFLGIDQETGDKVGMVSQISEVRPFEYVSIEHLGLYKNGEEDTTSAEAQKWANAYENYLFEIVPEGTKVSVELGAPDEYTEMFNDMWPRALQALKDLAERDNSTEETLENILDTH